MSYKARRLSQSAAIAAFSWQPLPTAQSPSLSPPDPVDVRADATSGAAADLAVIEREAFAAGHAQGERAGAEAAARRAEPVLRRLTQTIDDLVNVRGEMIRRTERQMVELVLAISRRVLHREVSLDPDLLISMARVALDRLGANAMVTVRLHPEDHAATAATSATEWRGTGVTVVGDASVNRGGCRLETDFGTLEVGVDAQIRELGRALLGEPVATAAPSEPRVA